MALHSLHCADVPLRNCSLTHSITQLNQQMLSEVESSRTKSTGTK